MEDDATLDQEVEDRQISNSLPTLQHVEKSDHITDSQPISTTAPVHNKSMSVASPLQSADESSWSTISGGLADALSYKSSLSSKLTEPQGNISPHKSPPEVLSSIENTTTDGGSGLTDPVQDRHSSNALEMSARDYNVKKPSLKGKPFDPPTMPQHSRTKPSLTNEPLDRLTISQHSHTQVPHLSTANSHLSSSVDSHHPSKFERSHLKQSQKPNNDSSTTENSLEYVNKPSSPQEESWVKQLFIAREKASQAGDQQRQLDEREKRQFASGSAKFTTMFEDPTSGGDSDRRAPSHKAGMYLLDENYSFSCVELQVYYVSCM